MFRKNKLAVAVAVSAAAAVSVPASALDLNITPATYASELDVSGGVDLAVNGVTLDLPIGVNVGTLRYARINLQTGTLSGTGIAGAVTGGVVFPVGGGTDGDDFVIFSIATTGTTTGAALAIGDDFTFTLGDLTVETEDDINVDVTFYETQVAATSEVDPISETGDGTVLEFARALSVDFTPAGTTPEAKVGSDYFCFTGTTCTATTASIGSYTLELDTSILDSDGTGLADLSDIIDEYDAEVTGRFDYANDGTIGAPTFTTLTAATLGGFNADSIDADSALFEGLTATSTTSALDFYIEGQGTTGGVEPFNAGNYEISFDITPQATSPDGTPLDSVITLGSGVIGSIERDGTNVELPYLTTFSDYNQRIVIVNLSSQEVEYNFSAFTTEDGTTATAGDDSSGVVDANTTLVLSADDVVTLVGKTRTAATLNVGAQPENIEIAVQSVLLSNGTTDTVLIPTD